MGQAQEQALQNLQRVALLSRPWGMERVYCAAKTWDGTHAHRHPVHIHGGVTSHISGHVCAPRALGFMLERGVEKHPLFP